jgi:RimK family alpha-L-glutamate ligase
MRIVVLSEPADKLAARLAKRIRALNADCYVTPLRGCDLDTARGSLNIPGFGNGLPDAVFVRTVQAGSFEEVTMRLGVLHLLRECGVLVWNDARAIERCVDKSMTSALLARNGIPTPATFSTQNRDRAAAFVQSARARGKRAVCKPLFGSQGKGLLLLDSASDLPDGDAISGVWYLQEFVETPDGSFHDHRLLISAGKVIGAMTRHGDSWVTNIKRGAKPVALAAAPRMRELATVAAAATGADYAGVDIIIGSDGNPLVLEVNSMPAWSGLQSVSGADLSAAIAKDFVAAARRHAASRLKSLSS